jgi:enoyl-CoA hydratase/carnithine racemase
MWASLANVFDDIRSDKSLSVVIVSGAGNRSFAAGADIGELAACLSHREKASAYIAIAERALSAISACPIPVVAAIRGYCIGAGLEIALACDFRLATSASEFGAPPAKIGANYAFESTKRLVNLVGPSWARRLLLTGRRLSAVEAHGIGLVDHCGQDIDTELSDLVGTLTTNSSYSIAVTKQTILELEYGATGESDAVRTLRLEGFSHPDLHEGVNAFLEKRTPRFRRGDCPR